MEAEAGHWSPSLYIVAGGANRPPLYQKINQYMTWSGAKNECERQGGYLVTITSQGENQYIYLNISFDQEIWMGATDQITEGIWKWITGEEFNYTHWADGEPNNNNNFGNGLVGQDYLKAYRNGFWDDDGGPDYYEKTNIFVCEWNG